LSQPSARLRSQMRRVRRAAVPDGQVPARPGWLARQRDQDAPCPRCWAMLARDRIAGGGTVWCPHCQPR
jgi:formamidopyrimidine-DNA glycosylase